MRSIGTFDPDFDSSFMKQDKIANPLQADPEFQNFIQRLRDENEALKNLMQRLKKQNSAKVNVADRQFPDS
jgi:hypothetical protein